MPSCDLTNGDQFFAHNKEFRSRQYRAGATVLRTQPPSNFLLYHPYQTAFIFTAKRALLYFQTSKEETPRAKALFQDSFLPGSGRVAEIPRDSHLYLIGQNCVSWLAPKSHGSWEDPCMFFFVCFYIHSCNLLKVC